MIREYFNEMTKSSSEACFLISRTGEILAANPQGASMPGPDSMIVTGRNLADLVADPEEKVSRYLRSCLRAGEPVPGALHWRSGPGRIIACRCNGHLLTAGMREGKRLVLLRCVPREAESDKFIALNRTLEQVKAAHYKLMLQSEELKNEVAERIQAESASRASQERLLTILDSLEAIVYVADMQTYEIIFVNKYTRDLFGNIEGKICWQTLQADQTGPCDFCTNAKLVDAEGNPGNPYSWEFKNTKIGRWFYIVDRAINWVDGRIVRLEIATDVTERKRAEEALKESEARYIDLYENAPDMYVSVDARTASIAKCNQTLANMLERPKEEIIGRPVFKIYHPDCLDQAREVFREFLKQGEIRDKELLLLKKDGSKLDVSLNVSAVRAEDGAILFSRSILRDITERKRAEKAMKDTALRLNEAQRIAHIGSWELDLTTNVLTWSDEIYRIFEIDPDKFGASYEAFLDAIHPDDREAVDFAYTNSLRTRTPYAIDHRLRFPDGRIKYVHEQCETYYDQDRPIRSVGTVQDITESKRAEETLRERESFIRNILDSVDEGFIVVDREYRIVSANRAFCDFIMLPEDRIVGQPCYWITHRLDRPCFESGEDCAVKRTFETGEAHTSFHTHELEGGVKQYVEIKSYPITDAGGRVVSAIETVNDVTERRKLEEQLRQAQKMEAVGTLSGGIAHDFNNILTAIMGYANIIKIKMRPDDPQRASIDQILASSDRAAHLTQGLLAFSKKQVIKPRPVDLNDIVRNVEKLLRRIIGEDISLITELSGTSLIAMADSVQIEQVLMNFATNARDAMPRGGTLTISTREVDLGEDFVAMHGFGKPGRHALIAVSDTGQGMDEMTREHIFDPFFTTKKPGKGTGLGLAIVYGIVKQHNGNINVYSEPGKGSTFKIYLPLIEKPVETTAEAPAAAPRGGTETVLLAEDDREVRNLTAMVLKEYGYRVIEAVDGEDAVSRFKARGREVDLLLLDVIMPRKSGKEVYDAIKAIKADVAALFISGYTADMLDRKGILGEDVHFISKPISPFELLRKVREVLDGKNVSSG